MFEDRNMNTSANRSAIATPVLPPPISGEQEVPVVSGPEPLGSLGPKRKKRNILLWVGLGAGVVTASAFGYHYWQYASTHQTTDNAIVAGHIHPVSSKISGTVAEVLASDNQAVQSGQLLVKLDAKDYENKMQQAQAALEAARLQANAAQANIALASQTTSGKTTQAQGDVGIAQAAITTAQATVQEAQAGISLAQTQVAQANANLQKAQADYNRYNGLYQQGAVPRQQLDTAKAAYDVAQAQKNSALQGVQQAQARLTKAQAEIASAQAKLAASQGGLQQATATGQQTTVNRSQYQAAQSAIAQSQAALKEAQLQLSYINITAPSAGRIGKKTVEVGNRISAGSPLMAVVGNDYWIVANFKETQLAKVHPGQLVEIKVDALGHTFVGRIDSIAPASGAQFALLPPDNATGNFTKIVQRIPVKIILNPDSIKGYDSQITLGMSAEVTVEIN
jgi:membrane fusion protein, multidrug efflux system